MPHIHVHLHDASVEETMHEYKQGTLHSGSKKGPKVKSRKQAIAIALKQAGKSNQDAGTSEGAKKAALTRKQHSGGASRVAATRQEQERAGRQKQKENEADLERRRKLGGRAVNKENIRGMVRGIPKGTYKPTGGYGGYRD
jgi:hypothetical protein